MALIVPKFRRESWYGRLYLRAYGKDRGWVVRLMRMTGTTGFGYAPYPTLTADMPEAEQLMTLCNWRSGREEARDRAIAFLMAPPPVQPFVEDGAKVSICPTFWKIVFALFVYCPFAALRAVGHAIATTLRAAGSAIADAFRWVGRRYGRPIEYTAFSVLALFAYGAVVYSTAFISYRLTGEFMPRQGMSRGEAVAQEFAAETEAKREYLRRDYLERCAAAMRPPVGGYVLLQMDFDNRESNYRQSTRNQAATECRRQVYDRSLSHEELERRCRSADDLYTAMIERVADCDFDCVNDRWSSDELYRLFATSTDREALAAWLATQLRATFADKLKAEHVAREQRIAEAHKQDAKIVGAVTVELITMQQNPIELYEEFMRICRYYEYDGDTRWVAIGSWSGVSNTTCATLAGLFSDQIDDAKSAIRWQQLKESALVGVPDTAKILGLTLVGILLLLLLIFVLKRFGQPLLRGLAWFFERVLGPGLKWFAIIVFAPIWAPARYLVWPALKAMGRAWLFVWNVGPVAYVRHAFTAVFGALANGIRRFFAAIGQILADTWHLLRAFASAKWKRLCPFTEWT